MDGININSKEFDWALQIACGKKTIETRNTNSLKSHIGQRVYIVRTGVAHSPQIIGEVTIGEPIIYHNATEFDADVDRHLVTKYSKYYIKDGGVKYGHKMINPVLYDRYYTPSKGGVVIRKNINLEEK